MQTLFWVVVIQSCVELRVPPSVQQDVVKPAAFLE
jgi:hypothetical protein